MKKEQVFARMKEDCLVAVVRAKNYEQGEKVVDAIIEGGINFIELTMTMDEGDPVEFIKMMANKYKGNDKIVIGAGTVLDPETARACILAGASYIVSPGLNVDTHWRLPLLSGMLRLPVCLLQISGRRLSSMLLVRGRLVSAVLI